MKHICLDTMMIVTLNTDILPVWAPVHSDAVDQLWPRLNARILHCRSWPQGY